MSVTSHAATEKFTYGRAPSLDDALKVELKSGVTAGIGKEISQSFGICNCFISEILIAAETGNMTIENIRANNLVWATDEETGETALKEVVQLFRNETEEWVHVTVNTGEEIVCTPNHPFYAPVKGWTAAVDLRAGDRLQMLNGEYVIVEQVQHELLESPETTYNFEVADFHTYYVGETEVLVHNKCNGKWSSEKYGSASNANHHFNKHGSEVGARTLQEYTKKATNFANQVLEKGIKGRYVSGPTPNTYRYVFNGKYVDMAWDGVEHILVSFGRI